MSRSNRRLLLSAQQPHTPPPPHLLHQDHRHQQLLNIGAAVFLAVALTVICICYTFRWFRRRHNLNSTSAATTTSSSPDPKSELHSIPIVTYCGPQHHPPPNPDVTVATEFEMENCAICLAEFEIGEKVRVLPRCGHVFHVDCIDQWLVVRSLHCPVCRDRTIQQAPPPEKTTCNSASGDASLLVLNFGSTRNFSGNIPSYV